jgi:hypothetical protein
VTYLRNLLGPVLSSLRELRDLVEVPVYGVVSAAFPRGLAEIAKRQKLRFVAAAGAFTLLFGVVLFLSRLGVRLALPEAG